MSTVGIDLGTAASGPSHTTTRDSRLPPQLRRRASSGPKKAGSCSTLRPCSDPPSHFESRSREAAGHGDPVRAIALSSQGEVVVPVDRHGQALSLAPVSMDARGEPAARAMSERFGAERVHITGQPLNRMFSVYKIAAGDAAWRPPAAGPTVL